ncbi:MAG: hypothetical protein KC777_14850 [Cyanobacteria bacterium HKST-UBA02]|nr:hypothetical protein [Cyanobacteria bacterium HKST-UBA02]
MNGRDFFLRAALLFCLAVLIWHCIPGAGARVETRVGNDPSQEKIIENWKKKAVKTALGGHLVQMLDGCNQTLKMKNDKDALYHRAYICGMVGATKYAIADLSRAIETDPRFAPAYTERGICYSDSSEYDRAWHDLNRAVSLDPSSGDALLARAKLMIKMNRPNLAFNDLERCKSGNVVFRPLLPGELPANYHNAVDYYLGQCYELMWKPDLAYRCYVDSQKKPELTIPGGYIKRYSDKPTDTSYKLQYLEASGVSSYVSRR